MDIKKPLIEYHKIDIQSLKTAVENLPDSEWLRDEKLRNVLATGRPGNAIYLLNNVHSNVRKDSAAEFSAGSVNVLKFPLWQSLENSFEPLLKVVTSLYPDCSAVRIQLAKLFPGESISPHVDTRYLTLMHRLHIPLVTDSKVHFIIDGEKFYLKEGYLYELNNMLEHAVDNRSDVTRIHLLIDLVPTATANVRYHDNLASMARG